jgi:hypothetical protein
VWDHSSSVFQLWKGSECTRIVALAPPGHGAVPIFLDDVRKGDRGFVLLERIQQGDRCVESSVTEVSQLVSNRTDPNRLAEDSTFFGKPLEPRTYPSRERYSKQPRAEGPIKDIA